MDVQFIMNKYIIGHKLGSGNYGDVYEVTCINTGRKYALKKLKYSKKVLHQRFPSFKRELQSLQILTHPNIVGLIQHFEEDNIVCIVLDYCSKGDLTKYIVNSQIEMNDNKKMQIFSQILQGIYYIHQQGYMHRDLKPQNIMLTEDLTAKIGDFGMIKKFQSQIRNTTAGTPVYASPQVLNQTGRYTKKCDVFSLGLILYFIVFGFQMFHDANNMQELINLQKKMKPAQLGKFIQSLQCSDVFKQIFSRTLCYEEKDRMSMEDLRTWFFNNIKLQSSGPKTQQDMIEAVDSFFMRTYKQVSKLNEFVPFMKQLQINRQLKIKSIKRCLFIYLLGCHLIIQLNKIVQRMRTQKIGQQIFLKVKQIWIGRIQSKIKQYTAMCERTCQAIIQKNLKSTSLRTSFDENSQLKRHVMEFLQHKFPSKINHLEIVKTFLQKEEFISQKDQHHKIEFLRQIQQII